MIRTYSKIIGTGGYLPPHRVTNETLVTLLAEKGAETSDEWITIRTGISARHYVAHDVKASDLGVLAASAALQEAHLLPNEIDLIIVATSTPDYIGGFPSTACVIQHQLGITNTCAAFDIQAVCSGFLYGITLADSLIQSGTHRNVLLIGTEVFSHILDFTDRKTCVLFGDGAGAIVLQASETAGILANRCHADGRHANILCMPGNICGGIIKGSAFLSMDGPAVFKLAVSVLEKVAIETLTTAGLSTSDINWFIPHQANIRIMQNTAKKLDIPIERMVITVDQHGNTSSASIPLALDKAVRDGRILPGHHLLMEGVGAGLTWGASVVRF